MWATTDRFPESPTKVQSFSTFSEYLRHQFHLSKNGHINAAILNDSCHQKILSPSKGNRSIKPEESAFFMTEQTHDFYDYPASPSKVKPRPQPASKSRKQVSPFEEMRPPGPGSYNVSPSLLKPTFNRTFSTPHYNINKHKDTTRSYAHNEPHIPEMKNSSGAFLNYTSKNYRSLSAPPGGRTAYKVTSPPRSPQNTYNSEEVCARHPAMLNRRYPPASDQIIKRWSTVATDSYKRRKHPKWN